MHGHAPSESGLAKWQHFHKLAGAFQRWHNNNLNTHQSGFDTLLLVFVQHAIAALLATPFAALRQRCSNSRCGSMPCSEGGAQTLRSLHEAAAHVDALQRQRGRNRKQSRLRRAVQRIALAAELDACIRSTFFSAHGEQT